MASASYETTASRYSISGGKILTHLSSAPITMSVYKFSGTQAGNASREQETYYGARSNEFGYANYQILLKGPENLLELPKGDDTPNKDQAEFLHVPVQR